MSIAILGGGVEGQSVAKYFATRGEPVHIFNNFSLEDIPNFHLENFDLVFRSPSVRPAHLLPTPVKEKLPYPLIIPQIVEKVNPKPAKNHSSPEASTQPAPWTSITNYFFTHCPAEIIGVTGTKGKGTTCSLITSILRSIYQSKPSITIHLVGNIGVPALDILDKIKKDDVVVYELSSFQLWDLTKSPHIAVITRIEPDHLDVHLDFDDYVNAKANIAKHQTPTDFCIYYQENSHSTKIAHLSPGTKLPYPPASINQYSTLLDHLAIPGPHNRENAAAALLACAAHFRLSLPEFITTYEAEIINGLSSFHGLPHRLEFVRELGGVKYYDDNYSSAFPALDVAIETFKDFPTILIAGGKDRGLDLSQMKNRIFSAKNLKKVILIGETKEQLAAGEYPSHYHLATSLEDAVHAAQEFAEHLVHDYNSCLLPDQSAPVIVLMSPGAASFDMFQNFSDRGEQFQELVSSLT